MICAKYRHITQGGSRPNCLLVAVRVVRRKKKGLHQAPVLKVLGPSGMDVWVSCAGAAFQNSLQQSLSSEVFCVFSSTWTLHCIKWQRAAIESSWIQILVCHLSYGKLFSLLTNKRRIPANNTERLKMLSIIVVALFAIYYSCLLQQP